MFFHLPITEHSLFGLFLLYGIVMGPDNVSRCFLRDFGKVVCVLFLFHSLSKASSGLLPPVETGVVGPV